MLKTNSHSKLAAGWVLALAAVVGVAWGSSEALGAKETTLYKENRNSFYTELFDQNFYGEGVNQLDAGRWGRKFSGEKLASRDVNIFDEVPDSGFFTNRQGREKLPAAALEKGYQETPGPDLNKPFEVTAAEQRGIYPRFWIKDARGDEYLLEFDPQMNPELVTGAEVVASRFYYALGYFVPQFTIAFMKADQFHAAPGAMTWEDTGFKKPLSQKRLEEYLMILPQTAAGLYRASASKVLKGASYGNFSFTSRREEDAADPVNHRDRREIRALGIFAAWLNHFDIREGDTLDVASEGGLRHYLTDFNGALGATQEGPKAPMLGYEHAADYGETFKAILSLGFWEKPWQKKWRLAGEKVTGSPSVGYFSNEGFDPAKYKTQFPFEAFRNVTRADGFWAAKLMMSFSDEDIRAMVKAGQYSDPKDAETLAKTLIERRDLIARYWMLRANALDGFSFSDGKLSFDDLAVRYGFTSKEGRSYHVEIGSTGAQSPVTSLDTKESFVAIQPSWIPATGSVPVTLRVLGASKETTPAVTVLLSASGIQGIQRED